MNTLLESFGKEPIENDILWIPDDPDLPLQWKIDPVTGEYTEMIRGHYVEQHNNLAEFPSCPPGFKSGISNLCSFEATTPVDPVEELVSAEPTDQIVDPSDDIDVLTEGINAIKVVYHSESLLSAKGLQKAVKYEHWAKNVNVSSLADDYDVVVPDPPSFVHPFELDNFQKQAVYHMERGESVFVAAHTSAGKTAVAEYAIGMCQKHLTRAIYTSPIKALSNQKFRDFRETFGEDEIGLLTGDVQINPDAPSCLIMTTEILRSMLYRDSEMIREVEWVVFDEVHYVNDAERGVVWEEVIIMLPPHVRLVLLSATTPNTFEFADWIGRTRAEIVYVITTLYRPVPLEHHLYLNKELFKIVDGQRVWSEASHKNAVAKHQALKSKQAFIGGSVLVELVYFLKKRSLLPCVIFSFSRRKCEEYADGLSGVDLNDTSSDHSQVHHFFSMAVSKLSFADRDLPQLHRMEEMLKRGIAVHHSGLLPIMKETVEILFSKGLVKVLFATETFAMGVNMPTRTVVFSGLKKHDGSTFRLLHPGEYTQMAGRAGRRGKDQVGTVIILGGADGGDMSSSLLLQGLLLGVPTKLASQFRITYGMILGLLRFEALQVEEMLKRSFSENANQKQRPEQKEQIERIEKMIADSLPVCCPICSADQLAVIADLATRTKSLGSLIYRRLLTDYYSKLGAKYFDPGRVILIAGLAGGRPAVVLNVASGVVYVLATPGDCSSTPFPHSLHAQYGSHLSPSALQLTHISPENIVCVTSAKLSSVAGNPSERQIIDIRQRFAQFLGERPKHEELGIPEFKVLELDEQRIRRNHLSNQMFCLDCPQFAQHYEAHYKNASLISRLAEVKFSSSDNSLILLPEYHSRVQLLKHLGFVDEVSGAVLLKGRVACEIRTVENTALLVVIELLFSGFFMKLGPPEISALLSTLYFQERVELDDEELLKDLPDSLVEACYHIHDLADELISTQRSVGVQVTVDEVPLRLGLVPVVFFWSRGFPFSKIALMTDVLEGTIVRCVVRLEEGLRELGHASKIMGDMELAVRFEEAAVSIKRDICFASSLYL